MNERQDKGQVMYCMHRCLITYKKGERMMVQKSGMRIAIYPSGFPISLHCMTGFRGGLKGMHMV